MNEIVNRNHFKFLIFACILLSHFTSNSQINREVFHEDFEKTVPNIQAIWAPTSYYSIDSGFTGNGLLFNSPNATTNFSSYATVDLTNLLGRTIALSASIKGENLTGGGTPGMVIQLVATPSSGGIRYYRIPLKTGTFPWEQVGRTLKIEEDIVDLKVNIGMYNATGKFWVDNVHIQVISEPMPPARDPLIAINKTHPGMYRGVNVAATSDNPANTISKNSLDELSYDWKAKTIRVMIGGEKYYPDGLLLSNYDAVLQEELHPIARICNPCPQTISTLQKEI